MPGTTTSSGAQLFPEEPDPSLRSVQSGVWRIVTYHAPKTKLDAFWKQSLSYWKDLAGTADLVRFFVDIYHLGPGLFMAHGLSQILSGFDDALKLYFTNLLLLVIEHSFISGQANVRKISFLLSVRMIVACLGSITQSIHSYTTPRLQARITMFCRRRAMHAHLNIDLLSSYDQSSFTADGLPQRAHGALRSILGAATAISSLLSQLLVIASFVKTQKAGVGTLLFCLVSPLVGPALYSSVWTSSSIYFVNHSAFRRVLALYGIATSSEHKQEVISGGLKNYLTEEYNKAASLSKDATDRPDIYHTSPVNACLHTVVDDLPLVFYVLQCLWRPETFSMTFLATLQQMTYSFRIAYMRLTLLNRSFFDSVADIKAIYAEPKIIALDSGTLPYPSADSSSAEGMSIRFSNVSFSYPSSKEGLFALNNISFDIPASALVVIVGANGSGKSTIVKILAQLHRPSTGGIFIGKHPIHDYRLDDLYDSITLLTQDHSIFPLSIGENIGLGNPLDVDNMKKIREAARLGGASDFIEKLKSKYDEELYPVKTCNPTRYPLVGEPLRRYRDEVERTKEISGGEHQRLAASRTFMRLLSDRSKLVVVDEPTSAMDPSGEFELFERLRSMRKGKTMVFVTHRFGHLTKHADLILCMSGGVLVESGTHKQLMEKSAGEYRRLYDIQARAFVDIDSSQ